MHQEPLTDRWGVLLYFSQKGTQPSAGATPFGTVALLVCKNNLADSKSDPIPLLRRIMRKSLLRNLAAPAAAVSLVLVGLVGVAAPAYATDSVTVLPYAPDAYEDTLKVKTVEVGSKYTLVSKDQARGSAVKGLTWRVSSSSEGTCAVYETKKGAVKAKFNSEGKCKIIWEDPKTDEKGIYYFYLASPLNSSNLACTLEGSDWLCMMP